MIGVLEYWSIGVLEYWSIGVYADTKKTNLEGWLNIDIDSSRFNFRCLLLKYGIIYNAKNIKVCFLVYAVANSTSKCNSRLKIRLLSEVRQKPPVAV